MTAVAAKVYMATKQLPKLTNFWRGELRCATKHALNVICFHVIESRD